MFKMKWFLVICLLLAVSNIVNSRPNKEKDSPIYDDDDVLNDDDGYGEEIDEDGDGEDEEPSDPPVIKTEPLNITATVGDTVDLPCETENAESFSVMWKHDIVMIFQDKIQVGQRNDRYQRFSNQTLQIRPVEASDQGVFECLISTSPELISVKHTLIVLSPPTITKATANHKPGATIERGHSMELECVAEGNPTPKVSWSKNGHRVSAERVEHGISRVSKQNVGREDAGLYTCMADNGLKKDPTLQTVNVEITHKPDMKVEREIVGETEMHLICKVHANPSANVTWTRNNNPIKENGNIILDHRKHNHEHVVKILNVDKSYFGNYTCHARNNFGHAEKQIIVSGTPTAPKFEFHRFVGENNELKTKWTITSMSPIKTIQMQFRKKGENKLWQTEEEELIDSSGFTHDVEYLLKHLGDGVYDARMRAENKYGWSEFSRIISLEGKPSADSIKKEEITDEHEEPESSTDSGSRTIISWTAVFLVIMLNMYSSFV